MAGIEHLQGSRAARGARLLRAYRKKPCFQASALRWHASKQGRERQRKLNAARVPSEFLEEVPPSSGERAHGDPEPAEPLPADAPSDAEPFGAVALQFAGGGLQPPHEAPAGVQSTTPEDPLLATGAAVRKLKEASNEINSAGAVPGLLLVAGIVKLHAAVVSSIRGTLGPDVQKRVNELWGVLGIKLPPPSSRAEARDDDVDVARAVLLRERLRDEDAARDPASATGATEAPLEDVAPALWADDAAGTASRDEGEIVGVSGVTLATSPVPSAAAETAWTRARGAEDAAGDKSVISSDQADADRGRDDDARTAASEGASAMGDPVEERSHDAEFEARQHDAAHEDALPTLDGSIPGAAGASSEAYVMHDHAASSPVDSRAEGSLHAGPAAACSSERRDDAGVAGSDHQKGDERHSWSMGPAADIKAASSWPAYDDAPRATAAATRPESTSPPPLDAAPQPQAQTRYSGPRVADRRTRDFGDATRPSGASRAAPPEASPSTSGPEVAYVEDNPQTLEFDDRTVTQSPQPRRQITLDTSFETIAEDVRPPSPPRPAAAFESRPKPATGGGASMRTYTRGPLPSRVSVVTVPRGTMYVDEEAVLPADPLEEIRYDRLPRSPRRGGSWQTGGPGGSGGGRSGKGTGGGGGGGGDMSPNHASMLVFAVLVVILLPMWYFIHLIISKPEWVAEKVSKAVKMGLNFSSNRLKLLRSMKRNKVATQRRVMYHTLVVKRHGSHVVARRLTTPVLERRHSIVEQPRHFVVLPRPEAEAHPVTLRRSFSESADLARVARRARRATTSGTLAGSVDYANSLLPRATPPGDILGSAERFLPREPQSHRSTAENAPSPAGSLPRRASYTVSEAPRRPALSSLLPSEVDLRLERPQGTPAVRLKRYDSPTRRGGGSGPPLDARARNLSLQLENLRRSSDSGELPSYVSLGSRALASRVIPGTIGMHSLLRASITPTGRRATPPLQTPWASCDRNEVWGGAALRARASGPSSQGRLTAPCVYEARRSMSQPHPLHSAERSTGGRATNEIARINSDSALQPPPGALRLAMPVPFPSTHEEDSSVLQASPPSLAASPRLRVSFALRSPPRLASHHLRNRSDRSDLAEPSSDDDVLSILSHARPAHSRNASTGGSDVSNTHIGQLSTPFDPATIAPGDSFLPADLAEFLRTRSCASDASSPSYAASAAFGALAANAGAFAAASTGLDASAFVVGPDPASPGSAANFSGPFGSMHELPRTSAGGEAHGGGGHDRAALERATTLDEVLEGAEARGGWPDDEGLGLMPQAGGTAAPVNSIPRLMTAFAGDFSHAGPSAAQVLVASHPAAYSDQGQPSSGNVTATERSPRQLLTTSDMSFVSSVGSEMDDDFFLRLPPPMKRRSGDGPGPGAVGESVEPAQLLAAPLFTHALAPPSESSAAYSITPPFVTRDDFRRHKSRPSSAAPPPSSPPSHSRLPRPVPHVRSSDPASPKHTTHLSPRFSLPRGWGLRKRSIPSLGAAATDSTSNSPSEASPTDPLAARSSPAAFESDRTPAVPSPLHSSLPTPSQGAQKQAFRPRSAGETDARSASLLPAPPAKAASAAVPAVAGTAQQQRQHTALDTPLAAMASAAGAAAAAAKQYARPAGGQPGAAGGAAVDHSTAPHARPTPFPTHSSPTPPGLLYSHPATDAPLVLRDDSSPSHAAHDSPGAPARAAAAVPQPALLLQECRHERATDDNSAPLPSPIRCDSPSPPSSISLQGLHAPERQFLVPPSHLDQRPVASSVPAWIHAIASPTASSSSMTGTTPTQSGSFDHLFSGSDRHPDSPPATRRGPSSRGSGTTRPRRRNAVPIADNNDTPSPTAKRARSPEHRAASRRRAKGRRDSRTAASDLAAPTAVLSGTLSAGRSAHRTMSMSSSSSAVSRDVSASGTSASGSRRHRLTDSSRTDDGAESLPSYANPTASSTLKRKQQNSSPP